MIGICIGFAPIKFKHVGRARANSGNEHLFDLIGTRCELQTSKWFIQFRVLVPGSWVLDPGSSFQDIFMQQTKYQDLRDTPIQTSDRIIVRRLHCNSWKPTLHILYFIKDIYERILLCIGFAPIKFKHVGRAHANFKNDHVFDLVWTRCELRTSKWFIQFRVLVPGSWIQFLLVLLWRHKVSILICPHQRNSANSVYKYIYMATGLIICLRQMLSFVSGQVISIYVYIYIYIYAYTALKIYVRYTIYTYIYIYR